MSNQTAIHRVTKPASHRRWLLWIVAFVLILSATAWYAYQQRMVLIISSANSVLQPYGFSVDTLTDLQMRPTSLHLSRLSLRHDKSNALQTLRDIHIDYTPTGLINAQLNSVRIASADIRLPDSAAREPAGAEPVSAPVSVGDILASIPFSHLHIGRLQVAGNDVIMGEIQLQDLSADLHSLQMTCQSSRCRITSDLGVTVNKLIYLTAPESTELDLIAFSADQPIGITVDAGTDMLSLDARSSTLILPAIRVDDTLTGLIVNFRRINASLPLTTGYFDPAALVAHAEISASEIYTNVVDYNLWPMRLDQHLSWERETLVVTGALTHNNQRLLLNDLHHSIASGTGHGTLEIPRINFNDSTNKLSDLISPLPWQADVIAGSASATARLNWLVDNSNEAAVTGAVQVSIDEISGYFNEIAFLRLSTDFAADLLPEWRLRSSRHAALSLASLDAGIEFNNLHSDYRIDLESGSVSLTNASIDVFGGTVSSAQMDYRLQNNDSRFTIVIDSIDLNKVLGMTAYQGVSATGLVSGQLPVRLQGLTPSIRGGTLTALQPGGTIRYGTGASGAVNPSLRDQSLDLVYRALEHYDFNLMETTVDYQESGELDLTIRMEGISPELNDGQRINLNLTINDDIPALLQSLQAARSVTESIQMRLEARQQ